MAGEDVVIRIRVDADTDSIDRVRDRLVALKLQAEALEDRMAKLSGSSGSASSALHDLSGASDDAADSLDDVGKSSDRSGAALRRFGSTTRDLRRHVNGTDQALQRFGQSMQSLSKFFLKGVLLNTVALGLSLGVVSAGFKTATLATQAWSAALTAGAAAGASLATILTTLAAGQREYLAATQATTYRNSRGLSGGLQESTMQLRALESNTRLAVMGAEALNAAFVAVSQNTAFNATIGAAMEAMGDFAASSTDPKKSLAAAGTFLGLLNKNGKVDDAVLQAAEDVGPQFLKAVEDGIKSGRTSSQSIMEMLISGDAARGAGVEGALTIINDTLFGTVRRNFQLIKSQFADFGMTFLPDATAAMERIADTISLSLIKVGGSVKAFGSGTFIEALVSGFEKMARWGTDLFNEYLPKADDLFASAAGFADQIQDGFRKAVDWMRPLLEGASVLGDTFGPLFKALFTEFGGGMQSLNRLLIDNRPQFIEFGESLLTVFRAIGDLSGAVKETFVGLLPVLTDVTNLFADIIGQIAGVMGALSGSGQLGAIVSGVAAVAGYSALGRLGRGAGPGGGLFSRMSRAAGGAGGMSMATANITAGTVYVTSGTSMVGGSPTGGTLTPTSARAAGVAGRFAAGFGRAANSPVGMMARTVGFGLGASYALSDRSSPGVAMLGGAAAGGSVGAQFGPYGALAGAGIGAAVAGIINDLRKDDVRRQEARSRASALFMPAEESIRSAMSNNDYLGGRAELQELRNRRKELLELTANTVNPNGPGVLETMWGRITGGTSVTDQVSTDTLERLRDMGKISQEEFEGMSRDIDAFITGMGDDISALEDELGPVLRQFDQNVGRLGRVTGQSAEEIQRMASAINVDLGASVRDFTGFIAQTLGVDIPRTRTEIAAAATDAFLAALDEVTNPVIARQNALEAVNMTTADLRESALAGTHTQADVAKFIRDAAAYELANTYDATTGAYDPIRAIEQLQSLGGAGGRLYGQGQALGGLEGIVGGDVQTMIDATSRGMTSTYARQLLGTIAGKIANESGGRTALDLSTINETTLGQIPLSTLNALQATANRDRIGLTGGENDADAVTRLLGRLGLDDAGIGFTTAEPVSDILMTGFDAVVGGIDRLTSAITGSKVWTSIFGGDQGGSQATGATPRGNGQQAYKPWGLPAPGTARPLTVTSTQTNQSNTTAIFNINASGVGGEELARIISSAARSGVRSGQERASTGTPTPAQAAASIFG